jgi:hypothetical protein
MRKIFLLIGISLLSIGTFAQSQFMLYQMNNRLPQSNLVNPSFFPDYKVTVGLPVVSTTFLTVNTGKLTFNNAFTRGADDSLRFNPQQLASKLDESNRIEAAGNTMLFQLGIRAQRNYFSLSLSQRVDGGLVYPRTLVEFLGTGTGEEPGKVFAFENLGLQANWYHELALGYGRQISDKLSIGVRAKILSGIAGFNVDNVSGVFISDTDSLYMHTSPIEFYTSGLDLFENASGDDIFRQATGFNNVGYAFDFGFNYEVIDNLTISASVTDLGSIKWQNDTKLIKIDEVSYSFKGEDFINVVGGENNFDAFSNIGDTLSILYEPDTIENISYRTSLATKMYAGATYQLGKMHSFGALLYGDFFKGTFNPGVGLSYNLTLGQIWSIGVNASYRNKSFENFGLGTALTLGPVQIYALSENLMAFSKISDASYVDARVGINLVFGKMQQSERVKKEKKPKKNKKTGVPTIDLGSW